MDRDKIDRSLSRGNAPFPQSSWPSNRNQDASNVDFLASRQRPHSCQTRVESNIEVPDWAVQNTPMCARQELRADARGGEDKESMRGLLY
jgi:hypothetical protein